MKTGGRCGNRAGALGEDGLIALAVRSFIGAVDVRRKRNMTKPLEMLADAALVMRNEAQRAHSKLAARENFGFKFTLAKENPLPHLHLAARPDKCLPRFGIELASQEDFDFPSQMFGSRGARWRL